MINVVDIELSDPVCTRYQAAFEQFLQTWPQSTYVRQITFPSNDPDEMRAVLDSISRPTNEQRDAFAENAEGARAGRMPLAVFAAITHRTLTEVLIERAVGPLVAVSRNDAIVGAETARSALDGDVVADLAALHVIAEIVDDQPELAQIIDVAHRQVLVTETVARDIRLGASALTRPIAGRWVAPAYGNPGYAVPLSATERARIARSVAQLQDQLAKHRIIPSPAVVTVFGERAVDMDLSIWDRTIQAAHDRNLPLWSDDSITRAIAREAGLAAFGTLDLIHALARDARVTGGQVAGVNLCFLKRGIADIAITPAMLLQAASASDWAPNYAGAALARPEAWSNPQTTIATWTEFVRSTPRDNYQYLPAWTFSAVLGAARAPYVLGVAVARTFVAQIMATVVYRVEKPDLVADCLTACTEGVKSSGVDIPDPLPLAVQLLRDILTQHLPTDQVTPYLLGLFSGCTETVQSVVRRSLLQ